MFHIVWKIFLQSLRLPAASQVSKGSLFSKGFAILVSTANFALYFLQNNFIWISRKRQRLEKSGNFELQKISWRFGCWKYFNWKHKFLSRLHCLIFIHTNEEQLGLKVSKILMMILVRNISWSFFQALFQDCLTLKVSDSKDLYYYFTLHSDK